jgi:hypothetical protein
MFGDGRTKERAEKDNAADEGKELVGQTIALGQ